MTAGRARGGGEGSEGNLLLRLGGGRGGLPRLDLKQTSPKSAVQCERALNRSCSASLESES